jgi:hypothetical protein
LEVRDLILIIKKEKDEKILLSDIVQDENGNLKSLLFTKSYLFLFDENGDHRKVSMKNIESFQLTKENVICIFIPKESDLFILSKKRRDEILNILKENHSKPLDSPKKLNFKNQKNQFSDIESIRRELKKIVENGIHDFDFTEKLIETSQLIGIENELDFKECLKKFEKQKDEIQIKEKIQKKLINKKYQGILKLESNPFMTDENKIQLKKLKEFEQQKNYLCNLVSFDNVEISNELKDYLHLELKRAKKYSEFQCLNKLKKFLNINENLELKRSKLEISKNPMDHYIKIEHKGFPENRIDPNKFLIHISTFDRLGNGLFKFIKKVTTFKRKK